MTQIELQMDLDKQYDETLGFPTSVLKGVNRQRTRDRNLRSIQRSQKREHGFHSKQHNEPSLWA